MRGETISKVPEEDGAGQVQSSAIGEGLNSNRRESILSCFPWREEENEGIGYR